MENILQKSVARVLGSDGNNSPFGTAFLFAEADEEQFWMTCHLGAFVRALQAIVAGSRDRTLADAPELNFSMAAEILFLIETLEARG